MVSTTNYGVYATVSGSNPNNYAGYFNGDIYVGGAYVPSDLTLKKDVTTLGNTHDLIKKFFVSKTKTSGAFANKYLVKMSHLCVNYGVYFFEVNATTLFSIFFTIV
ncbi:MAG TPA: hypothetical protein PLP27_02945 [Crocinitomicaceae bacterium]|nr:hypothetical protein [Crocinitomicaceae bacterium]